LALLELETLALEPLQTALMEAIRFLMPRLQGRLQAVLLQPEAEEVAGIKT
jgi:hypothetical protein